MMVSLAWQQRSTDYVTSLIFPGTLFSLSTTSNKMRRLTYMLNKAFFPSRLLPPPSHRLGCASLSTKTKELTTLSKKDSSENESRRTCKVYNLTGGCVPYEKAWVWQQLLLRERMTWQREIPPPVGHDVLLLLEHPSVYTLGRGSTLDNLRFDPADPTCPHEVRRTERGGEVTWHGPGQLVGYPVLDLNYHKKDLHWYLRQLEEVIIRVLAKHNLEGERETEHTGVWVHGAKIAAIGLNASRWITSHGFSLNVNPDLAGFEDIVPCGIQGRPVTRLCDLVPCAKSPNMHTDEQSAEQARADIIQAFKDVFGLEIVVKNIHAEAPELEAEIFPTGGDTHLLDKLYADSDKQLDLERQRKR